jgi:hypothetical protein
MINLGELMDALLILLKGKKKPIKKSIRAAQ